MVANPSSITPVNEHNTTFISSNIVNLIIYQEFKIYHTAMHSTYTSTRYFIQIIISPQQLTSILNSSYSHSFTCHSIIQWLYLSFQKSFISYVSIIIDIAQSKFEQYIRHLTIYHYTQTIPSSLPFIISSTIYIYKFTNINQISK